MSCNCIGLTTLEKASPYFHISLGIIIGIVLMSILIYMCYYGRKGD